ncbi:unnamed protein product [Acanthoscelides obtectus]|nr:unnamed protein product [Acanthoscelides obtectus]CAK1659045.1 hypothetical protein AOBTE_LOCUS21261 [Acanthoscelides obtectus]
MDNSDVFAPCSTAKNDSQIDSFFLCSQRTMSTFEDGPWTQMTKDFCILYDNSTIYERFNIAWIKKQSNSKLFKAPFLAAVIQSYEITNGQVPTVNVTLQDPTGCIQATILHSLYKEKLDYLTTGSVLVLKSFGVLCVQNSYCLTITENNLVRIYSIQTKKIDRDKKTSVEIIEVQKVNINEMLKNHNECLEVAKTSCGSKVNKISNIRTKSDEVTTNSLCNIFSTTSDKRLLNSPSHGSNIVNTLKSPSGCCIRDNVTEKTSTSNSAKTFNFKKPAGSKNDNISFSQVSVKTDKSEHTEIWKNLFEDIDAESLFSDF